MEVINNIRYMLLNYNWQNADEIFFQQDVNEFFTFLVDKFEITVIELTKKIFTNIDNKETTVVEKMPFIPLSLPNDNTVDKVNVKDLLHTWLYQNELDLTRNINNTETNITGLSVYQISNIPEFIALSINRFRNIDDRIETDVIIQKKITPFKHSDNNDMRLIEWNFHAAICHIGDSPKSGHYYALLAKKTKDTSDWYLFDDLEQPCLRKVDMDDKEVTGRIKKECVFLLYCLKF